MALVAVVLAAATTAKAQELEPRAFANAPVGLNFLILGYGYSTGDVSLDTSVPIEDGKITVAQADAARNAPLGLNVAHDPNSLAPY